MLVKNWMSKDVITVDIDDSMKTAIKLMEDYNIRRIPVLKKDRLKGIVSYLDINRESASQANALAVSELNYLIEKIKVKDIMSANPKTISPHDTVEEAAVVMLEQKIGSLPVIDSNGKLIGIITESDIFKVLISMTGIKQGGIQFAFNLPDKSGSIKEVADVFRSYGGSMLSIMTSYEHAEEGYRQVYIRMKNIDREELNKLINELKRFDLLYIVDNQERTRKIFYEF
ncbi:MAG: CBS domain-containing protein [Deltaproteobacteria bacterium]|jgi:acetoin utilization protein AcuB|nr:MAG: CBS domain-containing protein [Deltaproteobacteria bacterium]